VLNQTLVRFTPPGASDDAAADTFTRETVRRSQESGELWLSGTTFQGKAAMRISVSSWMTSDADVERSAHAILRAAGR